MFLNLAAIGCGLAFAFALAPPDRMSWRVDRDNAGRFGVVAAGVALVFATFVSQVHLGHAIDIEGIGRFLSHYSAGELQALQKDRDSRWRMQPPIRIARLSKEDQYLDEALWHVRQRNSSEPFDAWHENLILERFFVPVLDLPTYASATGTRWPPEQRANVQAAMASAPRRTSSARRRRIRWWLAANDLLGQRYCDRPAADGAAVRSCAASSSSDPSRSDPPAR